MRRWLLKFIIELVVWICLTPLAFYIRLDDEVTYYSATILTLTGLGAIVKFLAIYFFGFHRRSWHRVGVPDLFTLLTGIGVVSAFMFALSLYLANGIPRSGPIIEFMLSVVVLSGIRMLARVYHEQFYVRQHNKEDSYTRILIIGAGEAGTKIAREMLRNPKAGKIPIGFLDDEVRKQKEKFIGLPVLGKLKNLSAVVTEYAIDEILIAIPSYSNTITRQIISESNKIGVKYRILPGIEDVLNGLVTTTEAREVSLEDLLRRKPIILNNAEIQSYITGKVVLITGAGGSIGSEILRQIARFGPAKVLLFGRGENSIYQIDQEIKRLYPNLVYKCFIGDVKDKKKLRNIFKNYKPVVVFHAAAHKHVPLMEENPEQAILNNVGGTQNLVKLSLEFGVHRFVNISTDKAVNPTSVMGASKRVAEYVVSAAAVKSADYQSFVSVRFGNVLGSRGSVVPLFKEQIAHRRPITVTHPEMTRYFMTIPEASQLVLQAGGLGQNGSVYVLDMGEPVKIVDLAKDLILLSGLEPFVDVPIHFTGMRAGEKLYEELLTAEEGTESSKYEKIFIAHKTPLETTYLNKKLDELFAQAKACNEEGIRDLLHELIPGFKR